MYLEVKHENLDFQELVASHWKLWGPLWKIHHLYIRPYWVSPLQSSPIQSPKVLRGPYHDWEWDRLWFQSISPPHWCFKYVKTFSIICIVEWHLYIWPYRVSPLQSSPIQSPKVLRGPYHDWEWARLWFQSISSPHWCFKYVQTLSIICLVEWRKRIHVTEPK